MSFDTAQLPDTVDDLKAFIADFSDREYKAKQQQESKILLLAEEIRLLKYQLFGRKSEKLSRDAGSGQLLLFNEVEQVEAEPPVKSPEEITVSAHQRRRGKRKPLPEDLPRVEVIHDITEEEKQCACGTEKTRIGQETSEQLDIIPPKVQVVKHIRPKYVCKHCEGVEADEAAVVIAPLPEQLLPKSIAGPGLLAYIITSKYVDALPLYRQEQIFKRLGVDIARQTMSAWVIKAAEKCAPLLELIIQEIRSGPLIQMDETRVQVLDEPGRAATKQSYMWLFRGGLPGNPSLVYQYHPTRSSEVPNAFLGDYEGCVQTDGYVGYDFLDDRPEVKHLGCWAHVRRKFMEAVKARGKAGKGKKKKGRADVALDYITRLYAIEHSAEDRNLNTDQICALRRKKADPLLTEFCTWLDETALITPPGGLLGKAVSYALGQWKRLTLYIEDSRLHPDNNLAENAIRPFVVGRKNWMFSATPAGAHASAALYSLIETAKANNLEPYWYLRYIFDRLPVARTTEDLKTLLPENVEKKQISLLA